MDAANRLERFGVGIAHRQIEANEVPPEVSARETLASWYTDGNVAEIQRLYGAVDDVSSVLSIHAESEAGKLELVDIFTAQQITDMSDLMQGYLGCTVAEQIKRPTKPPGFATYVGRLALYIRGDDDDVTAQFSAFANMHGEQRPNAVGPREKNSRQYANAANEMILKQLATFYQAPFTIKLVGPEKTVQGGFLSWERGIAECQFLALDYICGQMVSGPRISTAEREIMSPEDIETNIIELATHRKRLVSEVGSVNQLLAKELDQALKNMSEYGLETFHRGKMGVPRFRKEPHGARQAILRVEELLLRAASLAEERPDQADIPILDI